MKNKIVTCDVETAQCENETVKCEKKLREPPNVRKELSHVMLELHNVRMEPLLRDKFKPLNEMLGNQTETQLWALEMTPIDFRCDNKSIQARRNKNCT